MKRSNCRGPKRFGRGLYEGYYISFFMVELHSFSEDPKRWHFARVQVGV